MPLSRPIYRASETSETSESDISDAIAKSAVASVRSGVCNTPDGRDAGRGFGRTEKPVRGIDPAWSVFDAKLAYVKTATAESGTRPDYLDWPCVRGDEFGPPIVTQKELATASKGKRQ